MDLSGNKETGNRLNTIIGFDYENIVITNTATKSFTITGNID